MRHVLITMAVLSVGCEFNNLDPDEWAACEFNGPVFHTRTDPNHCGGCYVRCEADVPCNDWKCQYNTTLHCGEPHRQCVAPDGQGVDCVQVGDGADVGLGDAGAGDVVNGFACVPVPLAERDAGVSAEPEEEIDEAPSAEPTYKRAQWLGIPGHSAQCHVGVDHRLCQQASVEFIDLCGSDVIQPLAYDFEIMTTEVSRAQYRATMCGDCVAPDTELCASVCGDERAQDRDERDARPITGLDWCEAYTVCHEMGARLPTVPERARVEALAHGSRALFRQSTSCSAWTRETGRAPWLAECFDDPPDMVGFDRVDGLSGLMLFGVDVLSHPQAVHHLVGNVDEWLADPAEALTTERLLSGPEWWSASTTLEQRLRPRLARGRSLFSPAGQPGSRMLVLEPNVKANDLGVRCARTSLSPYSQPVPFDYTLAADEHARCLKRPIGLRPVRQMNGERVYRADDICVDVALRPGERLALTRILRSLLVGDEIGLARATLVDGRLMGLGLARFATDEQWWLAEPVRAGDDPLSLRGEGFDISLVWSGEDAPVGEECRRMMTDPELAATDGLLMRVQTLEIDRAQLGLLVRGDEPARIACARFNCVDGTVPDDQCPDRCPSWSLPVAVVFERVEPFDRAAMCIASTDNPAER